MLFDVLRLIIGVALLGYGSYTDIKTRRVKNIVWVVMAGLGAAILLAEYASLVLDGADTSVFLVNLIVIPIIIILAFLFFQLGVLFGGADSKAWMAIAILAPLWPVLTFGSQTFPLLPSPLPFPFVVMANALVLLIASPLVFAVYNVVRRDVAVPYLFLGYKMAIDDVPKRFVWPMERVEDGAVITSAFPKRGTDIPAEVAQLRALGKTSIWVTPKIPFIVPMTAGYVLAFFVGDLVYALLVPLIGM